MSEDTLLALSIGIAFVVLIIVFIIDETGPPTGQG